MTVQGGVIDGKYEVVRELSREGHVTLSEVRAGEGVTRHLAWFDVASPAARQGFHAYRAALRAVNPAGLTDVVARPGAYYAVWQPVSGTPLSEVAAQPTKQEEVVQGVQALAAALAAHGHALPDADVVVDGREVRVAYLRPAPEGRTPEEVQRLNVAALAALGGGRIKRKRQPGAWLTFVPGLLFLGGAVYLGAQAAQVYLNPPVREVASVTGQPGQQAARTLTDAGFRVEYTLGDASGVDVGAVIRQDPAAGTNLPVGRLVTLTVNNPPSVPVPRLEELSLTQARAALRDGALVPGKIIRADGTLTKTPEGRVIAQVPEAGATIERGQPVSLIVSTGVRGKETYLPNLTGLEYEDAREHVRLAGLVVTRVIQQPSDAAENTILDQTPAPYVRVPVNGPVTLTVATARYSPPAEPAGSLPLPPPPVVPEPEEEEPQDPSGEGTAPAEPPTETAPTPEDPAETPTPVTPPESVPEETAPTEPEAAEPEAVPDATRTVNFRYEFPADLPAGTYTISVRDADGERQVDGPYSGADLAGAVAESDPADPLTVRGNAVIVIRRDGEEYATVTP
ncbi:beta-lactam-binding protein with PASTA domain [Deinococcus sp. HSC-46F16]|uniref:PASTA domain-containing protein n=1 Tax=Deinococcus sp. HSC-46F16 TaxID=2910968 RepID=UPI00209F7AF5|nr:PASTA domain-containing protein [Deinococcus sp. HSC-46F16]MCP2013963.1 beta-lactam-binding protein with PASTA domain [Deinococcus sp. HSC-46F16]